MELTNLKMVVGHDGLGLRSAFATTTRRSASNLQYEISGSRPLVSRVTDQNVVSLLVGSQEIGFSQSWPGRVTQIELAVRALPFTKRGNPTTGFLRYWSAKSACHHCLKQALPVHPPPMIIVAAGIEFSD